MVWTDEEGRRHRHSLGTADRASAEAAARSFWQRRSIGGQAHTVGEAVDAYLAEKSSMLSIKRATVAWKAAKPFWGNLPVARIDGKTPDDYRAKRAHCKPITVRNELAVIRAALNWAEKAKLISKAPFIKMPAFPSSTVGHLSKAEFRRLLENAQAPHIRLFLQLAVGTGARTNALLDLTWDRVDFDRNVIILNPHERVQTSKYRATVPMNAQLRAALEEAKAGAMSDFVVEHGRERVASIKNGFAAAARRAGLKATPHMMRHSAAVWMAEANTPFSQIAQFLGHTDSRITERVYGRFSPSFLANAAEALTY
ncbi:tyrosine-type recombinase/integrase [Sphingobium sp. WCS2017Hpa-17]|uniref:tyrosine-type recombinase/integrase n=1 Tax=Sphingobium sp. WCS2017Hpa-17 TaxID=3073638 RepID=UPI00386845EF